MAAISDTLRADLRDPEFAEVYAETFLDTYVSTQIKVLREQRELTQKQLAEALGTTQTVVSRIESVNYSSWNIRTLKKVARALGVRLVVSFESFGSLIGDMDRFGRDALQRPTIADDPELVLEDLNLEATSVAYTDQLGQTSKRNIHQIAYKPMKMAVARPAAVALPRHPTSIEHTGLYQQAI